MDGGAKSSGLPVEYNWQHLCIKVLALLGGYLYVALIHLGPGHGPAWLLWTTFVFYSATGIAIVRYMGGTPERTERQYLTACLLDLLVVAYLFFLDPELRLAMLVYLMMISGFYNFVLPRASGVLVSFLCGALYLFAIGLSLAISIAQGGLTSAAEVVASVALGVSALAGMTLFIRRLRKRVDAVYETTEELALDLSMHAMDATIAVDVLMERNREINTLLKIQQDIAAALEWDQLFEDIVTAFRGRFIFDKFCIYLQDKEDGKLHLTSESGAERATGVAAVVEPGQGVVGWCFTKSQGVLLDNAKSDPRYAGFNERGKRIQSLACQPLVFRGERLGVMCMDSEKASAFDAKAFKFLESLAALISIAVQNSLSFATVKAESHTDNLTGLNNHRGFMAKFQAMVDTAYTDETALSVLMIDIDHFKVINDTYGHLVGNLILKDLSDILMRFFRTSDLVGRYGGEEFITVLRGTPPDIAPRIAEQLRRKVEANQFPVSLERDIFRQVTISIGVSTTADSNLHPEIASGSRHSGEADVYLRNADDLSRMIIDNADQALYVAKREGRNQVMLSHNYPVDQVAQALLQFPESAK